MPRVSILRFQFAGEEVAEGVAGVFAFVEHGIDFVDDRRGDAEFLRELMRGAGGVVALGDGGEAEKNCTQVEFDIAMLDGCHVQWLAAPKEIIGENGKVIAFEPNPKTYNVLLENSKNNPNFNIIPFYFIWQYTFILINYFMKII